MIYIVKKTLYISLYDSSYSISLRDFLKGGMLTPVRPEAMTGFREYRIKYSFKYNSHRFMHNFVPGRRNSKRPRFPVCFRYVNSSSWSELKTTIEQGFGYSLEVLVVYPVESLFVHSWRHVPRFRF